MWNWIRNLFGNKSPEVSPVAVVMYCEDDGELLKVEKNVLKYSPYTGQPVLQSVVKSCPKDGKIVQSEMINTL